MSKELGNISIEVNELKGKSIPSWEVIIPNKKAIGIIGKVEGRYHAITNKSNNILFSKSLESGTSDSFSYFALHEK